jgi:enterochelin esterase-like enzyme
MQRALILAFLVSAVLAAAAETPWRASTPDARGRVARVPAPSLHEPARSVLVCLPASYAAHPERRYPVVMFLHGEPGAARDWVDKGDLPTLLDRLAARGAMPEVIALLPDACGPGDCGRSLYMNARDGRTNMEDFLVRDLVAWADTALRVERGARFRALVGISDGANAALDLAFRHPDVFGACAGHSGEYDLHWSTRVRRVVGSGDDARARLAAHSPLRYAAATAPRLRSLRIWFDCGLLDGAFLDDRALDRLLSAARVPHVYREWPGWHGWSFWRRRLQQSLPFVTSGMQPGSRTHA